VINAHLSSIAAPPGVEARVHRVGSRGFWMLFAIEGAFIAVALILVLQLLLPARAPLAQSADYALVRDAVWSRLNGAVSDPLVEIAPGVTVRSSGVRGLSLHGQTYYYYLEGQRGFDPLSRGAVDRRDVEIVLRDDGGPETLVIYRLIR
jgi:hypothetical protein